MSRVCLILLAMLMLTPAAARADVIAAEQQVCRGKKAGDPCSDPLAGVCERGECCRRRYGRDPSQRPSSIVGIDDNNEPSGPETYQECRACLRCAVGKRKPAAKPKTTPADDMALAAPDAAPDLPTAADMEPHAPDLADSPDLPPTPAPDLATPAAPDMAAAPAASPSGGMCASAPWRSDAGAWSLLAGALLLTTLTRRRRA